MWQELLLILTLPLSSVPVNSIKKYEVVYPRKLHSVHKREVNESGEKEKYETELNYQMTVNGKLEVLHLKKSKNLLAGGYSEIHYDSTGKEIITSPQIMDDCYYQGYLINQKVSDASISTCRGLRGYFSQGDQNYFIEPLGPTNLDEQEHALFKHDPEEKMDSSCGMDDVLWANGPQQSVLPAATSLVVCRPLIYLGCVLMWPILIFLGSIFSTTIN